MIAATAGTIATVVGTTAATAISATIPTAATATVRRREVYEWNGVVDREIQIQLRGNRAYVQAMGAAEDRNSHGRVINGLPLADGQPRRAASRGAR